VPTPISNAEKQLQSARSCTQRRPGVHSRRRRGRGERAGSVALVLRIVRVHVVVALPLARASSLPPAAPPAATAAALLLCRVGLVALQRPGGIGRGHRRAREEPLFLLELALLRALPLCRRVLLLQVVLEALAPNARKLGRGRRAQERARKEKEGEGEHAPRPRFPCWRSHRGSRPRAGISAGTGGTARARCGANPPLTAIGEAHGNATAKQGRRAGGIIVRRGERAAHLLLEPRELAVDLRLRVLLLLEVLRHLALDVCGGGTFYGFYDIMCQLVGFP
jgi:hypothetical protein